MKDNESNPFGGLARLLISLGLVMLAARTDLLGLGATSDYFTWQMLLIFFGVFSLLKLEIVSAVLLFATGFYFLMPEMNVQLSPFYKEIFWPAVLVLAGIAFMIRPFAHHRKTKY